MYRRASARSEPWTFGSPSLAAVATAAIAIAAGLPPTTEAFAAADPARLAAASDQVRTADHRDRWGPVGRTGVPFSPVVAGGVLPAAPWQARAGGAGRAVDLLAGHNRGEDRRFTELNGLRGQRTDEAANRAPGALGGVSCGRPPRLAAGRPGPPDDPHLRRPAGRRPVPGTSVAAHLGPAPFRRTRPEGSGSRLGLSDILVARPREAKPRKGPIVPIYALGEYEPQIHETAFVHPDAVVIGRVLIGPEASVWPCAVLRGDHGRIEVGARTSVQDGTVVHCTHEWPPLTGTPCARR